MSFCLSCWLPVSLQEAEEAAKEEAHNVSYKKDDFFDELSCEALEKMQLRGEGEWNRNGGRKGKNNEGSLLFLRGAGEAAAARRV